MAQRTPRRLNFEALFEYALRSLGARAQSAGELRQKLERRAERAEEIPQVLARLKQSGYLDDQRYAEAIAVSRLENQGLGKGRVLQDLRKRRVAPALAGKTVEDTYRGTDEVQLIQAYLRHKYRNVALEAFLAVPKNLASAYRRLRTAGFSSGNSIRVLKRFASEPEMLDAIEDEPERNLE